MMEVKLKITIKDRTISKSRTKNLKSRTKLEKNVKSRTTSMPSFPALILHPLQYKMKLKIQR